MNKNVRLNAWAVCKERPVQKVRPGWWVYTHGPTDLGAWGEVQANLQFVEAGTKRAKTRLSVANPDTGRIDVVEIYNNHPAWCCTAAQARKAGLTG